MNRTRFAAVVLLGVVLSGCRQDQMTETHHPATLAESGQEGILRVTLEARAAERIGLETAEVGEATVTRLGRSAARTVVPYSALMYDKHGDAWTYTNPEPLVFVRQHVVVEAVDGDRAILADGPPAGTRIVTVGATELMGAEHKYGH